MIAGDQVEYTVKFGNNGPDTISGSIPLEILVPQQIESVTYTSGEGTYNDVTKSFSLSNPLEAEQVVTILVEGTLSASYQGPEIQSSIIVGPPEGVLDYNLENNNSTISIEVTRDADLGIEIEASNLTPPTEITISFTVTVTNYGPSTANNVQATALLPSGFSFVSSNGGASYDDTTGIWEVGFLNVNESKTLTISANVQTSGDYTVNVSVEADEPDTGTHPNADSVVITPSGEPVATADLSVEIEASTLTPTIGEDVVLTFTFTNNGPDNGTNLQAAGNKPSGLQYVSASSGYNSGFDKWFLGNLAAGNSTIRTLTMTVLPSGNYTYISVLDGDQADNVDPNNSASVTLSPKLANKFSVSGKIFLVDAYNNSPGSWPPSPTNNAGMSFPDQIALHHSLGSDMLRFAIQTKADGVIRDDQGRTGEDNLEWRRRWSTTHSYYPYGAGYIPQCLAAGIDFLMVIRDLLYVGSSLWQGTEQEAYDAGYLMAYNAVNNYGENIKYFELSNEIELFRDMRNGQGLGTEYSHYFAERPPDIMASYVAGMHFGVKAARPDAITMYNTAGYFPRLLMDLVMDKTAGGLDRVAWHWYDDSTQGPIANFIGEDYDITEYLYTRYGKKIWYTESGTRFRKNLSLAENEQRQVNWYNKFFAPGGTYSTLTDDRVEKCFWFELLAQTTPYGAGGLTDYGTGNGWEQNYGLYSHYDHPTNHFMNPTPKQLAQILIDLNQ